MTLSTTSNKVSFSGNGSTTVFAYNFKILANSDLKVFIRSSTGVETLKTITTHYNVSGVGSASGGNVTFTSGNTPTNSETVIIQRVVPLTQTHDYVENDPFPAESHEEGLDRLTMHVQQIQEEVNRSIKASVTNTITTTEFADSATDRANKLFGFDSNGNLSISTTLGTNRGNWAASTVYSERDIVKDTSTNNIFQINSGHTSSGSQPLTSNSNSAKYTLLVDAATATTSAATATTKAAEASTSATASATSATASASSATAAAASFDSFDDKYLGAKGSAPSTDNDGDALANGALYWNTSSNLMYAWNGSTWLALADAASVASSAATATTKAGEAATSATAAASSATTASGHKDTATTKAGEAATSATAAATSASTASGHKDTATTRANEAAASATAAASSATAGASSASSASSSATSAAASFDSFDDRYLGAKGSEPSADNDGNTLITGALYFNSSSNQLFVRSSSNTWVESSFSASGFMSKASNLGDVTSASTSRSNLGLGTAATLTAGTGANNAVQLDGNSKLPAVDGSQLTNLVAGGIINIVADGAIVAGKPTILTAAGKAKQIAETTTVATSPTVKQITDMDGSDTSTDHVATAYEASSERFVMFYRDTSNSNYPTIVAGSWSSGTVTWGSPLVLENAGIDNEPSLAAGDGYVFASYDTASALKVKILTISGTTFTVKNTNTIVSQNPAGNKVAYVPASAFSGNPYSPVCGILSNVYSHAGSGSQKVYVRSYAINTSTGAVAGQTTEETFMTTNAHMSRADLVADPDNGKVIYATFDGSDGDVGKAFVIGFGGTASSPTDTVGTGVDFSGSDDADYVSACYDTQNNKVFITWRNDDGSNPMWKGTIGTVNAGSNSISYTGAATIWDGAGGMSQADVEMDTVNNKIMFFYRDDDNSDRLTYKTITPGASSFSVATGGTMSNGDVFLHSGSASFGANKGFLVGLNDRSDSNKVAYSTAFFATSTSTNLSTSNFLGLAAEAINDTATGKITIQGGVNENVSSLTIGTSYFATDAGAIATSGTQLIGKAVATNKIQIGVKTGTVANNTVALDASAKLPAVDGSQLTNVSVASGETFIAKSAIANKRLVAVTNDGTEKAEEVYHKRNDTKTNSRQSYWSRETNDAPRLGNNYHSSTRSIIYDPDSNKQIIAFVNTGDNYKLQCTIGSSNGSVITYGVKNNLDTGYHGNASYSLDYDTHNNKIVIFYRDPANSNSISARVGTLSGATGISFGSAVTQTSSNDVEHVCSAFDTVQNKFIVGYKDTSDGNKLKLMCAYYDASVSGGIVFGTPHVFVNDTCTHFHFDFSAVTGKCMGAYRNSNYLKFGAFQLNANNTFTNVGSNDHVFNYAAGEYMNVMANPVSTDYYDQFIVHYKDDGNSGYFHSKILYNNSTSTQSGSQDEKTVRQVGIRQMRTGFHLESNKGVVVFANQNSTNKSEYKTFKINSGGSSTYDFTATTGQGPDSTTNYAYYHDTVYDPDTEQQIIIMTHEEHYNSGDGNKRHGWGWHLKPNKPSNHDFYIGVAANAAAVGETVTVKTVGQVADTEKTNFGQGVYQYLDNGSTISSTQVSGITTSNGDTNTLIGRAISSTKMIVSYNYGGAGHDENYQVDD